MFKSRGKPDVMRIYWSVFSKPFKVISAARHVDM